MGHQSIILTQWSFRVANHLPAHFWELGGNWKTLLETRMDGNFSLPLHYCLSLLPKSLGTSQQGYPLYTAHLRDMKNLVVLNGLQTSSAVLC